MNALQEEISMSVANSQDEVGVSYQRFAPHAVNLGIAKNRSGDKRGSIMDDSDPTNSYRPSIRMHL